MPFGALYARATRRRLARAVPWNSGCRVVCVGSLAVGGSGKTPVAIALADMLIRDGQRVAFLSRGYGGRLAGPSSVNPQRHSAADVGDEPLLLAQFAPAYIAADRAVAARAALADAPFDTLIMDDGHQNPQLVKSLSLIVVDAQFGFGNARCLPAGPLREPIPLGLARADAVIVLGEASAARNFVARWHQQIPCPVIYAHLSALQTGMDWRGVRCLAFAGIGRPAKFFATLRALGADLVQTVVLADHQPLTPALMQRLQHQARMLGSALVTTEKDAVRLPPGFAREVLTLPVRIVWDQPGQIRATLQRVLTAKG